MLENLINFTNSVGWTLIHFSWQAILLVLTYWIITRSIPKEHVIIKYWTGIIAVVACLIIPLYTFINAQSDLTHSLPGGLVNLTQNSSVAAFYQPTLAELSIYLINISLPYLVLIWAGLVCTLSARLIKSWIQLKNIYAKAKPQSSGTLFDLVERKYAELNMLFKPVLKITKDVGIPATFGFFKPVIILPLAVINKLPQEQVELIVLHELCHIRRNDFLHNLLQLTTDTLFFFHPFVRWMNNDIRHVREQCCDQMVLRHNADPLQYAHALTNVADLHLADHVNLKVQIGLNDGQLMDRVKSVMFNHRKNQSTFLLLPLLCVIAVMYFMLISQDNKETVSSSLLNNPGSQESQQTFFTPNARDFAFPAREETKTPIVQSDKEQRLQEKTPAPLTSENETVNSSQKTESSAGNPNIEQQVALQPAINAENFFNTETTPSSRLIEQKPINQVNELTASSAALNSLNTNTENTEAPLNPATESSNTPVTQQPAATKLDAEAVIAPVLLSASSPVYPMRYRQKQIEGNVIANFKINKEGKIYDIAINSGNSMVGFNYAVTKALKTWQFDVNSLTAASRQKTYQRVFNFSLNGSIDSRCIAPTTGSRLSKPKECKN